MPALKSPCSVQCPSSLLWLFWHILLMGFHQPPPPLLQSPCAPLSQSRCRDQRGARAADLRAVRSCFFSCTLPSANKDHLALAQKLKRTCRESFFSSLSGYSVVTNFLFNVLLVRRLRNAEAVSCWVDCRCKGIPPLPTPAPPLLSNRFMLFYSSCPCTWDNWHRKMC